MSSAPAAPPLPPDGARAGAQALAAELCAVLDVTHNSLMRRALACAMNGDFCDVVQKCPKVHMLGKDWTPLKCAEARCHCFKNSRRRPSTRSRGRFTATCSGQV